MGARSGHAAKACFLVLAAVAFSLVAGCYDNPTTKVDSMICKTDQQCPVGYACKIPGVKGGCQQDEAGLDGGVSAVDASVDTNTPFDGETSIDAGHALDGTASSVD